MKVLMVNRPDAYRMSGGDTVQMEKTRTALQRLGVQVEVRLTDDLPTCWDYDLVHIFNLQTWQESLQAFEEARRQGLPVVLSSIYWDMSPFLFPEVALSRQRWRILSGALGYRLAQRLYVGRVRQWSRQQPAWTAQRHMLMESAAVLPNARTEADLLCTVFGLDPTCKGRMHIVPNAVDEALYGQEPVPAQDLCSIPSGQQIVLEVAQVYPIKNQLSLIRALFDVDVALIFVGRFAPVYAEYVHQCQELGVQRGKTYFLGHMEPECLPAIYARADVHALPSWRETPGLASLEAAASGCRIVSTEIGSSHEYFGKLARYCHPLDMGCIRREVLLALGGERRSDLREHVLRYFTWQHVAEATLQAYRAACQSQ